MLCTRPLDLKLGAAVGFKTNDLRMLHLLLVLLGFDPCYIHLQCPCSWWFLLIPGLSGRIDSLSVPSWLQCQTSPSDGFLSTDPKGASVKVQFQIRLSPTFLRLYLPFPRLSLLYCLTVGLLVVFVIFAPHSLWFLLSDESIKTGTQRV